LGNLDYRGRKNEIEEYFPTPITGGAGTVPVSSAAIPATKTSSHGWPLVTEKKGSRGGQKLGKRTPVLIWPIQLDRLSE
jgi:hypothetical protein